MNEENSINDGTEHHNFTIEEIEDMRRDLTYYLIHEYLHMQMMQMDMINTELPISGLEKYLGHAHADIPYTARTLNNRLSFLISELRKKE